MKWSVADVVHGRRFRVGEHTGQLSDHSPGSWWFKRDRGAFPYTGPFLNEQGVADWLNENDAIELGDYSL